MKMPSFFMGKIIVTLFLLADNPCGMKPSVTMSSVLLRHPSSALFLKMDKEKSMEKIDGAVATVMALDRAIRCGNDTSESVYDSRGLLFV